MNINLKIGIVEKGSYDPNTGSNNQLYESEVNYIEACALLYKLKEPDCTLHMETEFIILDFDSLSEETLGIEIFDTRDAFWAHAEITFPIAKKIIEIACRNESFEDVIPTTNDMWGAFGRDI